MSFGIRLTNTRDVSFTEAVFSLGSNVQSASAVGDLVALPAAHDGALRVRLINGDEEIGTIQVDLHNVQADSSEWFNLPSGGAVELHFDVLGDAADGTGSETSDQAVDDPFGAPPANQGGFDLLANDAAAETDEESEEEEEEQNGPPTPLQIWQEKHNDDLVQRATTARAKRDERKTQAREWLKKFYEDRDKQLATKADLNRQQNQALTDKINANLGLGSLWERVSNLINMNATSANRKDVSRMRSVLLQVKNNTPEHLARHDKAPAAGKPAGGASSSNDFF